MRQVALGVSLVTFAASLLMWAGFDPASAEYQFVERYTWLPDFGISYHVGVDGISLFLIVLTGFLTSVGRARVYDLEDLDDPMPALQNDLDLQLAAPDGAVRFPYRLDRANPVQDALRDGVNRVDNVEIVDASPVAGVWQVRINAQPLSAGQAQKATIVTTGLRRRP